MPPRNPCLTIEQVTLYFKQFDHEEERSAQTEPPKEFTPPTDAELCDLHIWQKVISVLKVDQFSSNFEKDVFDPRGYAATEYHDALLKEQSKEQEEKRAKAAAEKRQQQAEADAAKAKDAERKRKRASRWGGGSDSNKKTDQKVAAAVAAAQAAAAVVQQLQNRR
jgi:hypothetical protein